MTVDLKSCQSSLLAQVRQARKLARIIDKLPECTTKHELDAQISNIMHAVIPLYYQLWTTIPDACYFGFTDKCPNSYCGMCPHGSKIDVNAV